MSSSLLKMKAVIERLECRIKGLENSISAYKKGNKYRNLTQVLLRLESEKNKEIRKLNAELSNSHSHIITMRDKWIEAMEDVIKECEDKLAVKDKEITRLNDKLIQKDKEIAKLKESLRNKQIIYYKTATELEEANGNIAKLKAQLNSNFENSSIPSSQQGMKRKKIPNSREKTGRKPGGQKGHEGHCRPRFTPDEVKYIYPDAKFADTTKYKSTGRFISKQLVELKIKLHVTEYRTEEFRNVTTGQRLHTEFPYGLKDDVKYGTSIKAVAFMLNTVCNVSIDKTCNFLSDITGGSLRLSKGMINNLGKQFSKNTEEKRQKIFSDMQAAPVMNVDFTNSNLNGKSAQVLICANSNGILFQAKEHKGHEGVKASPLENYQFTVVHDHDITFYSYGSEHQECMQHIVRELKGITENEAGRQWAKEMLDCIRQMIHYRNEQSEEVMAKEAEYEVNRYVERYFKILRHAAKEYEDEPAAQEYMLKGFNLYKRLKGYAENMLLFLHDFRVPTNNSLCERMARIFKRKQKVMTVFRSFSSMEYLCDAFSMIESAKLQDKNVYEMVKNGFAT